MKFISRILIIVLLQSITKNSFAQDKTFQPAIGVGALYYPEGRIIGYTHSYAIDYLFAKHFGLKVSLDIGQGQNNDDFFMIFQNQLL